MMLFQTTKFDERTESNTRYAAYALVARLGQWRIERQIEKLSLGNS